MSLSSAADTLQSDLTALQGRMAASGWPVRARVMAVGISGPPGSRSGTGLFVRLNADGEDYVFTLTGNAVGIEQMVLRGHDAIQNALGREWPTYGGGTHPILPAGGREWPTYGGGSGYEAGYDAQDLDHRERRQEQRGMLHRHTFSIQRRPDGLWTACVCIPVPGGPLYLCATADEHAVAQALHGELSDVSGGRTWAGEVGDNFQSVCGAVAAQRAEDRLGASLRQMVADPGVQSIFSTIVPMIPVVGLPAAGAFQGAKLALEVVDKVNQGDQRVQQVVRNAAGQAKQGDPRAIKFIKALKMAQKIKEGKIPMPQKPDPKVAALEIENKELRAKLAACEKKWAEEPLDAADDVMDLWGGSDDSIGPDIIEAAGGMMGQMVADVTGEPRLARPIVARYYQARLPIGTITRDGSPEVGGLYHRPMRESSEASLRKDYLRGTALQTAGFPHGREYLSWARPTAIAAAVTAAVRPTTPATPATPAAHAAPAPTTTHAAGADSGNPFDGHWHDGGSRGQRAGYHLETGTNPRTGGPMFRYHVQRTRTPAARTTQPTRAARSIASAIRQVRMAG